MTVRYGASLTLPHPTVPYANVKPTLELEVQCDEADRDEVLAKLKQFVHLALGEAAAELHSLVK